MPRQRLITDPYYSQPILPGKGRLRSPNRGKLGEGLYRVPRSALQPGTVTRREWLRFLSHIAIGSLCSCRPEVPHNHWMWRGSLDSKGYGQFFWRGWYYRTHRFAYIALGGMITDEHEGDHLCRITKCCQPLCLDPVSKAENNRRGYSICAQHGRKTHCLRGHPLIEGNLYLPELAKGVRRCLICLEAKRASRDARRKSLMAARPPKIPRMHCKNGHPLTDENVLAYELCTFGQRICRLCVRANERQRRLG